MFTTIAVCFITGMKNTVLLFFFIFDVVKIESFGSDIQIWTCYMRPTTSGLNGILTIELDELALY